MAVFEEREEKYDDDRILLYKSVFKNKQCSIYLLVNKTVNNNITGKINNYCQFIAITGKKIQCAWKSIII